ncbi:MAG: CoA ester lyase [Pseudomonadota bacterium]
MTHLWRSLLFVPGDSDRKIAKSLTTAADIVIYDLEDAVVPEARREARQRVRDALTSPRVEGHARCVRINPMDTDDSLRDLKAVMPSNPDYIMLPKVSTVEDLDQLAGRIDAFEHMHRLAVGRTKIIALMTETAQMTLNLPMVTSLHPRVAALTWGGEDLSAELGAIDNKDANGNWTFTFQLARSQCLLAARACGVVALDTLFSDFRDSSGMQRHAAAAKRDGFDGVLSIHPNQVDVINGAFEPSDEEIADAQAIVDAFANAPNQGALQLNGRMLDKPHLKLAQKILQLAKSRQ